MAMHAAVHGGRHRAVGARRRIPKDLRHHGLRHRKLLDEATVAGRVILGVTTVAVSVLMYLSVLINS